MLLHSRTAAVEFKLDPRPRLGFRRRCLSTCRQLLVEHRSTKADTRSGSGTGARDGWRTAFRQTGCGREGSKPSVGCCCGSTCSATSPTCPTRTSVGRTTSGTGFDRTLERAAHQPGSRIPEPARSKTLYPAQRAVPILRPKSRRSSRRPVSRARKYVAARFPKHLRPSFSMQCHCVPKRATCRRSPGLCGRGFTLLPVEPGSIPSQRRH